ncbi:MAG TPA: SUMF1/EgtB/PvdO family nonheme iron enzyme [Verrucomicrobiae bacterium]|jgi:formylglycine-generating enzyme required for sulfatase activity
MKIKLKISFFLTTALIAVLPLLSRAQDDLTSDGSTNDVLKLKDLMTTNDVVTNTVGIVLVKVSPGIWIGKFEVIQKAYAKVMDGNPSAFGGDNRPVDSVSWNDVMSFCKKLTVMEQDTDQLPDGFAYTLPTEDQWVKLTDSASLNDAVMSLPPNHYTSTEPVGSLKPNSFGLYDTRGNVMEWCLDSHDPSYRVLRGGAWDTAVEPSSRIEFRNYAKPDDKKNDYGFRVILQAGASK